MDADYGARKIDPFMGTNVAGIKSKLNTMLPVSSAGMKISIAQYHRSWQPMLFLSLILGLLLMLWVPVSEGQTTVTTYIKPSPLPPCASPCSGGPTVVIQTGTTFNIYGGARPGTGSNLFHSFQDFSVGTGGTALFRAADIGGSGPVPYDGSSIQSIIGRVTGDKPSGIFGTLDTMSAFHTANLFLINPNGIVFGPSASLNVGGSVHFSTADYLRLTDGTKFFASLDAAKQSVLTSAEVAAFGFLGETAPKSITIQSNSDLSQKVDFFLTDPNRPWVPHSLSLVAGDISISGRAISTSGGRINLASVASAGEVVPNEVGQSASLTLNGIVRQGTVSLTDGATIKTSSGFGFDAGPVFIRSGRFVMDNAGMEAVAAIPVNPLDPSIPLPRAGAVNIQSEVIDLRGGALAPSEITIRTNNQGDITLASSTVTMDKAKIFTYGEVYRNVNNISDETGFIHIQGLQGEKSSARQVSIKNGSSLTTDGEIFESPPSSVRARDISVQAADIYLANSTIATDQGSIKLNGTNQILSGGYNTISKTAHLTDLAGNVNAIELTSDHGIIELSAGDKISSQITGTFLRFPGENAGAIVLTTPHLSMKGTSDKPIVIETIGAGVTKGGNVTIHSSSAEIVGADIKASSSGTGNAGNFSLTSGDSILIANSTVSTFAEQASGGNIDLTAPNMVRLVGVTLQSDVKGQVQFINGQRVVPTGGDITIDSVHPQFVVIQDNSRILASAPQGQGGNINIFAPGGVVLQEPGSVLDASSEIGLSGSINIQAPIQQLSGAIAPLPQAFAVATNLYGQRCAAEKGGQFSSFVQGARDGVPPQPGDLIPSPLMMELEEVPLSAGSQSIPSLAAIRFGLPEFEQTPYRSLTVFSGCRS